MLHTNLGTDSWAADCRSKIRDGLRMNHLVDFGGLQVGRVEKNIILGDGAWVEFPIACPSEAAAVLELQRLVTGINRGQTIGELLPDVELPAEIVNAWVR